MNIITKFLTLAISTSFVLASTNVAMAQSYWTLEVSSPASVQNNATFNLDYSLLSTEQFQPYTVELVANGANVVEIQNVSTNDKFGYNGRFSINNVPEGSYSYFVKATNNSDNSIQQSSTKNVTVDLPDAKVLVISSTENSSDNQLNNVDRTTLLSNSQNTDNGQEATAITETSSDTAGTKVEGQQDNNQNNTARNVALLVAGLAFLLALAGLLWSKFKQTKEVN